ncbi:hypothetical protein VRU48_10210 [Pedobacter sp. KR3-3]|uniref:Uncharacterized protein n=1 Tax=Pedobacter albus TaxID=3113905 RepID=A0ABU7I7M3_9SPHI|nr:hypothetical protein [Pedobacter sp. KR3-3]MEE1945483.1 hypothetical protein [Pedobacter sp. KR3-3]
MKDNENMEWEKEAAFLASLPRTTPYRVPDNYFDHLQLHINQSVFVDGLMQKEDQGFTVPQNYFEDLALQIEDRIATDQLRTLTATDGFKTPEGYFEKLQANILSQTAASRPKPKTIRLWQSDLMKYVSAACFIVLTASGLYLNQQNTLKQTRKAELANEQMLYDIDESVIIEHLQEGQTANASASDTEMENYILNHFSSSDLSNNL